MSEKLQKFLISGNFRKIFHKNPRKFEIIPKNMKKSLKISAKSGNFLKFLLSGKFNEVFKHFRNFHKNTEKFEKIPKNTSFRKTPGKVSGNFRKTQKIRKFQVKHPIFLPISTKKS